MFAAYCMIFSCTACVYTSEDNDSFDMAIYNIKDKFISIKEELTDSKRKCKELENKDKKSQELILQLQN